MPTSPRTIAVDLTPVLPGGENGGAKVFVLELLRQLAQIAPQTRFVLLTQRVSHDELSTLDAPNVQRRCVLDRSAVPVRDLHLRSAARKLLWVLPAAVKRRLTGMAYRLRRRTRARAAGGVLAEVGADLLYCPFTAPTYAEAGIPVVSTLYDLQYRTYPEFFAPEDVAHRDAVFNAACRVSTRIAAISDYARNSALATGATDGVQTRTIHLRIARRLDLPADPRAALDALQLIPDRYLLYPANFWRHKNHEMLIAAFGIAARSGLPEDFRLVCTGAPGERRDFLREAAAAFGLQQRIVFPGYVDRAELAALLANAAGLVFPSLYEGFGLPLLEAMAMEVPVACSNRTSLPEVAAGAALLFDPGVVDEVAAAMVRLVTDGPQRLLLAAAGRDRAREFGDTARMAHEYLTLFDEALAPQPDARSISGVHEDGWIGRELCIVADPGMSAGIELELQAPDWLAHRHVRLAAEGGGRATAKLKVRRGQTVVWQLPGNPGRTRVTLAPTFVPAEGGHGEDERELSLMLVRCTLHGSDGTRCALWPGRAA
jgi:glycosyltransferase involved in cell wall biosynthesis